LVCPVCRGDLSLTGEAAAGTSEVIMEGNLRCGNCTRDYRIERGVPVLLPYENRSRSDRWSFDFQWRLRFAGKLEHGTWLWGKDLSRLSYRLRTDNCWHLDCGCGSGDHTRNVALQNPTVQTVGLDLSNSVYWTSSRDREIENLHYVQGDILAPPFRHEVFNTLVAVGVWHSTGDTHKALLNSMRLLQQHGFVASWLYPDLEDINQTSAKREYRMWRRYYFFRDYVFLGQAHRLPPWLLLTLCRMFGLAISPFLHLLDLDMPDLRNRYRSNIFILLDDLSPKYQDRPPKEKVLQWFQEAGADKVVHNFRRGCVYTAIKA
jgi:uncharacterized protein YbaR (Trm112 family)